MFSWRRPRNLGVQEGRLAPPKRTPNCVSTQAYPGDREHFISPIAFHGDFSRAVAAVRSMPGATVIEEKADYLYAEFRSRLLRFVDDFEVVQDAAAGVIHVRSASRLGRRDFGVNRRRAEALRALLS